MREKRARATRGVGSIDCDEEGESTKRNTPHQHDDAVLAYHEDDTRARPVPKYVDHLELYSLLVSSPRARRDSRLLFFIVGKHSAACLSSHNSASPLPSCGFPSTYISSTDVPDVFAV